MGFAMGSTTEGTHLGDPRHTLQRLFVRDPCALDEMLDALQQGKVEVLISIHYLFVDIGYDRRQIL